MNLDYDYVVIGSGFGGSVSALRLAQKGYKVAVLEAGRRWEKSDFPKTNWNARKYLWNPGLRCFGPQRMELLKHMLVVGGCGVGGGSLVYGNTLVRPLPAFFDKPAIQRLGGADGLVPFYELAEKMMGVVKNPRLFEPDRILRKTAETYGRAETFTPSPVGIFFSEEDETVADPYFLGEGPERTGCTFCGGCFIGCQHGAKNTLDNNYLYLAEQLGVRIIAETEVTAIKPQSEDGSAGYELLTKRSTAWFGRAKGTIRAKGLVMAAGVMGTLRLLLAARDAGDLNHLSDCLGCLVRTNSESIVGVKSRDRTVDYSLGIAASSSVLPDEHTQVQSDRYPAGSDTLNVLSTLLVDGGGKTPRWLRLFFTILRRPIDYFKALWPFGFAKRSVVLVVMQDYDSSLRIVRKRRWFWPFRKRLASVVAAGMDRTPTYIPMANDFARRMAKQMNGIPMSSVSEIFLGAPATAHILGGCPIGDSEQDGVIDRQHRVFGYENFLVCDGSVIPANLAANPALSILALSERAMSFVPPKDGDEASVRFLKVDEQWQVKKLLMSK